MNDIITAIRGAELAEEIRDRIARHWPLVFGPGAYWLDEPINVTARSGASIIGAGLDCTRLIPKYADAEIVRALGAEMLTVRDVNLYAQIPELNTSCAVNLGRTSSASAPRNHFDRVYFGGHYTVANVVNVGSEFVTFSACRFSNGGDNPVPWYCAAERYGPGIDWPPVVGWPGQPDDWARSRAVCGCHHFSQCSFDLGQRRPNCLFRFAGAHQISFSQCHAGATHKNLTPDQFGQAVFDVGVDGVELDRVTTISLSDAAWVEASGMRELIRNRGDGVVDVQGGVRLRVAENYPFVGRTAERFGAWSTERRFLSTPTVK